MRHDLNSRAEGVWMTIDAAGHGGMGGGLVPGIYPSPAAMRPTLVGERWSVVAGHPLVSAVAAEVFAAGGNAIDAGVAAGLASNVVQVDMANFGGIAPILVRPAAADQVWSVAGVGRWSRTATLSGMLERHGGSMPLDGAPAIVPGAPAAWLAALARFGSMSLAEVALPAINLAIKGFLLDVSLVTSLSLMSRRFSRWGASCAVYLPYGREPRLGDRLVQGTLGELLSELVAAEESAVGDRATRIRAAHDAFYRGRAAHRIVESVTAGGGYMQLTDLADFEAEVALAPKIEMAGWSVFSTPSWSQGPVALAILGILERRGAGHNAGSADELHVLIEAITLAFNDREDHLAAPDQMSAELQDLIGARHLDELAARIGEGALEGRTLQTAFPDAPPLSTTAVVTMDASGATFATSPSDTLDGGPIIPELGIMCSPRGVQSRLVAGHPNAISPGGRPCVTPAALIALRSNWGRVRPWALACPGGDVIVQALAQVVWNIAHHGMDPQVAVEAPRIAAFNFPSAFHPHPRADRRVFVEGRVGTDVMVELCKRGHVVERWPDFEFDAGSVQTVMETVNDVGQPYLLAAADPRRSAYAHAR